MILYSILDKKYINDKNIRKNGDFNSVRTTITGGKRFHHGIDYKAPIGSNIYAANCGKVIFSTFNQSGFGNCIVIKHEDGTSTLYAHLKELPLFKINSEVKCGCKIGEVGDTGNAKGTEPHLHFECLDKVGTLLIERCSNNCNLGIPCGLYRLNPHEFLKIN